MFKGRHFEGSEILLCVRWYLAYGLSLRDLEEIMAERGRAVDHSTIHRWVVKYAPQLLDRFQARKRPVMGKWHVDETYIKVKGEDTYLYRAIDKLGATIDFMYSRTRNLKQAKRFFARAMKRHGLPVQITIDGSATNLEAGRKAHCEARMKINPAIAPVVMRQRKYKNNIVEQDHRRVKRRIRSMLGFKSDRTASIILAGIELVHMLRKGQLIPTNDATNPSLADQFNSLAA